MDNSSRPAVTAIADSAQESFITAGLVKLGYTVIYRATTPANLTKFLLENSEVLVVASDDYRHIPPDHRGEIITIRGKSKRVEAPSLLNPTNEVELSELIGQRKSHRDVIAPRPTRLKGHVIAAISMGRSPGVTTTAINLAHELAEYGHRVLLLDCNLNHLELSRHFESNGIYRNALESRFGFSIGEVSSLESLMYFAANSDGFEYVICDVGQVSLKKLVGFGNRFEDLALHWALQSAAEIHLFSFPRDLNAISESREFLAQLNPAAQFLSLVRLTSAVGSRDREKLRNQFTALTGVETALFARDPKAIEQMEARHSTVIMTSPKSALRSEISALASRIIFG